jgi:2-dehydropantoate 2-reductase
VVGGGAIGGITAAVLTQKGEHPVVVDADLNHVAAMRRELVITGCRELKIPVQAYTPDEMQQHKEFAGWADIVLLAVKGLNTESALRSMVPYISPEAPVVSLQNGINEDTIAGIVGTARTIGCSITWGGTNQGPGKLYQTSSQKADVGGFIIGQWPTGKTRIVQDVAELLSKVCRTDVSDNIIGDRWTKLLITVSLTGVGACAGLNYGGVLDNESARKAAAAVINETYRIGRDSGVEFASLAGVSMQVLVATNKKEFEEASKILHFGFDQARDIKSSMWQDIEKGRKTEVDFVNGYVVKKAGQLGKKAPINELVTRIVHEIENGVKKPALENLKEFDSLVAHLS